MDREEFIRLAVQALEDQLASSSSADAHEGKRGDLSRAGRSDGDSRNEHDMYARLTYDYPLLQGDDDVMALIQWCVRDMGDTEDGIIASYMKREDARRTIMENLHRGASSSSAEYGGAQVVLWQQLYGLHLFFSLGMIEVPFDQHDEGFLWPNTTDMLEESAWDSGVLVEACKACLERLLRLMDNVRISMLLSLLQQMCSKSRTVAHAVYSMLLNNKDADAATMKEFRVLLGHMTANIVMDADTITWSQVVRVLADAISVELEDKHHTDRDSLVMAALTCTEYLLRTMPKVPSSKSRIESIMIDKSVYICIIQTFIRGPQCSACARVLLLLACYSDHLFQWGCRVPGYCMAWNTLRDICNDKDTDEALLLEERMLCAMWNGLIRASHTTHQDDAGVCGIIPPSLLSDIARVCTQDDLEEAASCTRAMADKVMLMKEARMMTDVKRMLTTLLLVCSILLTQHPKAASNVVCAVLPPRETLRSLRASCRQRTQVIRIDHLDDANRRTAAMSVLEEIQTSDALLKRIDVMMSHDGQDDKLQ